MERAQEIAKRLMDDILYGNDYITRWTPFDEKKHYGDWMGKIADVISKSIETLGEDFYTEEVMDMLSDGEYNELMELIEKNPALNPVNVILNEYFEWLETIEQND